MPTSKTLLRKMLDDYSSPLGRRFAFFIQSLILLSIVTFSIETIPHLPSNVSSLLRTIEIATIVVFTIEYLLRLYVAQNRLRFATSFFGLVDLLAILPFYVGTVVDLRAIRIVRLIRLFRLLKVARYNRAIERLSVAFQAVRTELSVFLIATLAVLFLASVGIYYFERDAQPEAFASVFHAMWWALATLTTVGYGDVAPVTVGGRIFTAVVLLIGLGVVAIPSGLLAAALSKSVAYDRDDA